jgi:hypothetical protein
MFSAVIGATSLLADSFSVQAPEQEKWQTQKCRLALPQSGSDGCSGRNRANSQWRLTVTGRFGSPTTGLPP